jgi:malonyl-CoA decarboxylase
MPLTPPSPVGQASESASGTPADAAALRLWRGMRRLLPVGRAASAPGAQAAQLRDTLLACAKLAGGAVSARKRALEVTRTYNQLSEGERRAFFVMLVDEFGVDDKAAVKALRAVLQNPSEIRMGRAFPRLRTALESPRMRIFRQLNASASCIETVIAMRADALRFVKEEPRLAEIESELYDVLSSWFDVGFLELRRIDWNAPASLLEKLIAYEAVHEIRSWKDMRNRLDADRRIYAYFHPRLPDEPLIFVEVALVEGVADAIAPLLDESLPAADPHAADTAVFYSISSTKPGLRSVNLGDFLIKRVVESLKADLPNLLTFVTLSPLPGFRPWLDAEIDRPRALQKPEVQALKGVLPAAAQGDFSAPHASRVLRAAVARYLTEAKETRPDGAAQPRDPVARFHLGNGAQLYRVNFAADVSTKGLRQSYGMMVNYLYDLRKLETNHEALMREGTVATRAAVARLAHRIAN